MYSLRLLENNLAHNFLTCSWYFLFVCLEWFLQLFLLLSFLSVSIYNREMYSLYFWLILGEKKFRTYHIQNHPFFFVYSFYCWFSVFLGSAWPILFQAFGLSVWITITSPGGTHFSPVRLICFFRQSSEVDKVGIINLKWILKYLLEMLRYWKFVWNRQRKCYKHVSKPHF